MPGQETKILYAMQYGQKKNPQKSYFVVVVVVRGERFKREGNKYTYS